MTRSIIKQTGKAAFTLIELLVVMSVIALMISILLPALGKARDAARATQCSVNQRQLGVGMQNYMADFRQHMIVRGDFTIDPAAVGGGAAGSNTYDDNQPRFFDVLLPYLGHDGFAISMNGRSQLGQIADYNRRMAQAFCPNDRSRTWNDRYRASSYGVPGTVVIVYRSNAPGTGDGLSVAARSHNFGKVSQPSGVAFLGEMGHNSWYHAYAAMNEASLIIGNPSGAWMTPYIYTHAGTLNWLFFDGHVARSKQAPHALDYRVIGGTYFDGEPWTSTGTQGFLNRFHGGSVP